MLIISLRYGKYNFSYVRINSATIIFYSNSFCNFYFTLKLQEILKIKLGEVFTNNVFHDISILSDRRPLHAMQAGNFNTRNTLNLTVD